VTGNNTATIVDNQEKPSLWMGLFLFAVLIIIAVICYFRIEKVTQKIDLIITEKEIGPEVRQDNKVFRINIYENSDGGEYI
jgi:hypothetical protein